MNNFINKFFKITLQANKQQDIKCMEEECFICENSFNLEQRYPMLLCNQQHFCCQLCLNQLFKKPQTSKCPQCRQKFSKFSVKKFRIYERLKQNLQISKQQKNENRIYKQIFLKIDKPNQLLEAKNKVIACLKDFKLAAFLIRKIIDQCSNAIDNGKFAGLGSKQEEKNFNANELSLYDQLALMNMLQPNYQFHKEWYEKIIARDPSNYKALYGLALTQHNNGNKKAALQLYQKTIELKPDFDKPYELAAFIHLEKYDFKTAKFYSQQSLHINSTNLLAEYVSVLATGIIMHDAKFICESMTKIIDKQPKFVRALNQIQKSLFQNQYYQRQIKKCDDIASGCKYQFASFSGVIKYLHTQKQFWKAIQLLLKIQVKELTRQEILTYYELLGNSQFQLWGFKKAIQFFQKYLQIESRNLKIRQNLGHAYFRLKRYKEALVQYNSCLQADESNINIIKNIWQCYNAENKPQEAIKYLNKWIQLDPNNLYPYYNLAKTSYEIKDYTFCLYWSEKCLVKKYMKYENGLLEIQSLYQIKQYEQCISKIKHFQKQFVFLTSEAQKTIDKIAHSLRSYIKLERIIQ